MAEIIVSDKIMELIKQGAMKKMYNSSRSIVTTIPKILFTLGYWEKEDRIKMKIIDNYILVIYNPNAEKRVKKTLGD